MRRANADPQSIVAPLRCVCAAYLDEILCARGSSSDLRNMHFLIVDPLNSFFETICMHSGGCFGLIC